MLFNSFLFFKFLLFVLLIYYALPHRYRNLFLLISSYIFYGAWDWRFTSLLLFSTVVDYLCGLKMETRDNQKGKFPFLILSVLVNLSILGFFKYFNFFAESAFTFLSSLGFGVSMPLLNIVLPVGISFYTFQTLSYSIEIYRGHQKPVHDFIDFGLYVSFFPQLVAGPIERSVHLLPQLQKERHVTAGSVLTALQLIIIGLVKKVAIADVVAPYVDAAFSNPDGFSSVSILLSIYLFSIQIYCDFSGYTDMARGISSLFGVELMLNFRQPYFSKNISDFWKRWHISLSTWLRDYLYIPLGGNRNGTSQTIRNLMITMLLGGLWHGASWNFVIWGALHGVFLVVFRIIRSNAPIQGCFHWKDAGRILLTFNMVCFAWIFFRADNISASINLISNIFTGSMAGDYYWLLMIFLYSFGIVFSLDIFLVRKNRDVPFDKNSSLWVMGLFFAICIVLLTLGEKAISVPFIYFQF